MLTGTYTANGPRISRIGFGGMRFADIEDQDACAALVRQAYEAGVTYFDTAPGYFGGKSEQAYGRAFREMNKTRSERPFYVATRTSKTGYDDVRRDLETSLERLHVDAVDFYHVWCVVTHEDWRRRYADGVTRAFERLRDEGLVRHICISSHMNGPELVQTLDEYPFDGVQLGYCAMNFLYREAAVEAAAQNGRGVAVMNPLGGGLIPRYPERFDFVRTRSDESIVDGALGFLLSDPRISVAVVGIDTEEHLREVVAAADKFTPRSAQEIARVRAGLQESFNELCTGCRYCDACPEGVPVPKLMDAVNLLVLGEEPKRAAGRLRGHWGLRKPVEDLAKCTECGLCEEKCTQHLPIRERLAQLRKALTEQA